MTDSMVQRLLDPQRGVDLLKVVERPALWLPFTPRVLNPTALAGTNSFGDFAQPWPITALQFYVSIIVLTTNDAANFWSVALLDSGGTTRATVSSGTAPLAANTWNRLSAVPTQAATTNAAWSVNITKTGAPGQLLIVPSVSCFRTG